ncbi:MAG TPA: hypothetical protein VNJ53_05370 [Gaiellaceae bacterium]|nr:hypothetical protein [Gaiellaceae bacterium]
MYQSGLESLSLLDTGRDTAWHWVADAERVPYWDQASPIRQLLFWWLQTRGYLQVHAGAVGTPEGGVLLVGKSGSGKSTVSLCCLGSSLQFAGDDYVAVSTGQAPQVASLYGSAKLEPEHVTRLLPHLVPLLANRGRLDSEKALLYVNRHFPSQVTSGFPLRAVVVPTVRPAQRESRLVPISRSAAFAALAPSTIVQLHTARQDALAAMAALLALVPCYGLEFGSDLAAVPDALVSLLERLSSS